MRLQCFNCGGVVDVPGALPPGFDLMCPHCGGGRGAHPPSAPTALSPTEPEQPTTAPLSVGLTCLVIVVGGLLLSLLILVLALVYDPLAEAPPTPIDLCRVRHAMCESDCGSGLGHRICRTGCQADFRACTGQ